VLAFFANLQPCLLGLAACAGAHYWTRGNCSSWGMMRR
jgi:hypothetical protein